MVSNTLKKIIKLAIVVLLLPVYSYAWDCSVSISGPDTVEMGESITLSANGNHYGGTYSWSAWPYNLGTGQTINFTGKVPGKTTVWVGFYEWGRWEYKWSCYASKEITVTGEAWLRKVSGDNQKGVKGSYLYDPLAVEVVDKNNKPISSVPIKYRVKQSQPGTYWWEWGTLSDASWGERPSTSYAYTDSSGRANRKLKFGQRLGTYAVEASCANCTSGSPQTFTAEAVTVTLKKESGDNQTGQVKKGLKEPLVVKVTDANGIGVGGVYVSFNIVQKPSGSTGSYLSTYYTYTNGDGTASTTVILGDKVGEYKINAYCYAASGGSPQTFTAKAEDVSYTLSKASGDGQKGYIEKALKEPFIVKVTDANSKPVENVPIQWVITKTPDGAKGASISYAGTTTASDGTTGTALTFGDIPGVYTVEARCDQCGNSSPQVFTAEALGININLDLSRPQVYPSGTSGDPSTTIKVTAEYTDGTPVDDGYPLMVSARAIENSGGHEHSGQRPSGEFNNGSCRSSSSTGCMEPEISGTTTGGKLEVNYKSSKFGGIEKITAVSKKHPKVQSVSKDLTVRVPGMGPLGGNQYWRLTGSSDTTSTKKCKGEKIRHSKNHMATFSTAIRVAMLATAYYEKKKGRLGINDMSLPLGGLFDICSDWEKPHGLHRVGKSVDIDRSAQSVSNPAIFVDVQRDYLDELADSFDGSPVPEGTIHYEFQ